MSASACAPRAASVGCCACGSVKLCSRGVCGYVFLVYAALLLTGASFSAAGRNGAWLLVLNETTVAQRWLTVTEYHHLDGWVDLQAVQDPIFSGQSSFVDVPPGYTPLDLSRAGINEDQVGRATLSLTSAALVFTLLGTLAVCFITPCGVDQARAATQAQLAKDAADSRTARGGSGAQATPPRRGARLRRTRLIAAVALICALFGGILYFVALGHYSTAVMGKVIDVFGPGWGSGLGPSSGNRRGPSYSFGLGGGAGAAIAGGALAMSAIFALVMGVTLAPWSNQWCGDVPPTWVRLTLPGEEVEGQAVVTRTAIVTMGPPGGAHTVMRQPPHAQHPDGVPVALPIIVVSRSPDGLPHGSVQSGGQAGDAPAAGYRQPFGGYSPPGQPYPYPFPAHPAGGGYYPAPGPFPPGAGYGAAPAPSAPGVDGDPGPAAYGPPYGPPQLPHQGGWPGYPPAGYPPPGYPSAGYPPPGYPAAGYPYGAHPGYPPAGASGYPADTYPSPGAGSGGGSDGDPPVPSKTA